MKRTTLFAIFIALCLGVGSHACLAAPPSLGESKDPAALFAAGEYEESVTAANRLLREAGPASDPARSLMLLKAKALSRLGRYAEALSEMERREQNAPAPTGDAERAEAANVTGTVLTALGRWNEAGTRLQEAVELARTQKLSLLGPALYNSALLQLKRSRLPEALQSAREARETAEVSGNRELLAQSTVLCARLFIAGGETGKGIAALAEAVQLHLELPPSRERIRGLLAVGELYRDAAAVAAPEAAVSLLEKARTVLESALAAAGTAQEGDLYGYVAGELGRVEESGGRLPQALRFTRMAVFSAQAQVDEASLYLWQWQESRILKAMGKTEEALSMGRLAIRTLQRVRGDLDLRDVASFQRRVKPVYLGLADLLLKKAAGSPDGPRGELLSEVAEVIESLRADELKNYLRDACVAQADASQGGGGEYAGTAVIYYLVLEDRVEAVLKTPRLGLRQFTVTAPVSDLETQARIQRFALENRTPFFTEPSRKLYRWLIEPAIQYLQSTDTLVFVADGFLRSVPMAALYDGKSYLVEKYAVAMSQGISLGGGVETPSKGSGDVFLGGISESVGGFCALPSVARELEGIQAIYGGEVLQNDAFVIPRVRRELSENAYPLVHLASHGQFAGNMDETFILTWDGKLNINQMDSIIRTSKRRSPIELLTLSACSTAAGDDLATLGLAGIALKAGARSAIASLWDIDDGATAEFFVRFYDLYRKDPLLTKVRALREAQLAMLGGDLKPNGSGSVRRSLTAITGEKGSSTSYAHPFYWAPFVITGNWM